MYGQYCNNKKKEKCVNLVLQQMKILLQHLEEFKIHLRFKETNISFYLRIKNDL